MDQTFATACKMNYERTKEKNKLAVMAWTKLENGRVKRDITRNPMYLHVSCKKMSMQNTASTHLVTFVYEHREDN